MNAREYAQKMSEQPKQPRLYIKCDDVNQSTIGVEISKEGCLDIYCRSTCFSFSIKQAEELRDFLNEMYPVDHIEVGYI